MENNASGLMDLAICYAERAAKAASVSKARKWHELARKLWLKATGK